MKAFIWTAIGVMVGGFIVLLFAALAGCAQPINRPLGAPVLIMTETPTKDPAIRQHQQWVQVHGTVTLHKGETVVLLPATMP